MIGTKMRVLVTGSREITDEDLVFDALSDLFESEIRFDDFTVIHGNARGADKIAGQWARSLKRYGVHEEIHPADWDAHGKAAGPIRNQEMVDSGVDLCLAFFKDGAGNVGTSHCVNTAILAKIRIKRYTQS